MKILVYIPARGGSKRIPRKNIRLFAGKPLLARAIEQAKTVRFADRVVVDTDSEEIAAVAKKYGAEVPFLRPKRLAGDRAQVADALLCLLARLKKEEGYAPEHLVVLQTTSPLRELRDIEACWKLMQETDADTVLTVAPTHPRLYHLDRRGNIILANKRAVPSTNIQAWPPAYLLNGCFVYILKTAAFLKQRKVIMKNTKAIICDKWRSVDLDSPEEWVAAEFLFRHREEIGRDLEQFGRMHSPRAPMAKDFDGWNEVKKRTHAELPRLYTVREIWWCRFGVNIGTEQDGRGTNFLRPAVILRGFGADACLVVPLTTSARVHPLRVSVGVVEGCEARANLSQLRIVDTRRLVEKVGFLRKEVFADMRKAAKGLL
ncbi:MAG: type II toxin-antitoxin system PemK/MazF family toxin [Patescibacteria group bacterium]